MYMMAVEGNKLAANTKTFCIFTLEIDELRNLGSYSVSIHSFLQHSLGDGKIKLNHFGGSTEYAFA